jgi:hypothetical protein
MMVIAPFSPRVVDRIGTKLTVALGLVCVSVGLVLLGGVGATTGYADIAWRMALAATGMALTMSPATESIMGSLPLTRAGVGSAVNDTTRQVGGAVGVAVIGSVFSSIYGSKIVDALRGKGVPASVVANAKSSLGAALQTAGHLPGAAGRVFTDLAKTAFIDGFHSGVYVGAAASALGIIAVLIWLPARAHADDVERQAADFDKHGLSGPRSTVAAPGNGDRDTASERPGDGIAAESPTPARTR